MGMIVAIAFMAALPGLAAGVYQPYQSELTVSLSTNVINPGDVLYINITIQNPHNNTTVSVYISNLETGHVVVSMRGNMSVLGIYKTIFIPKRPIAFGDYSVWATANNQSAISSFQIEPSLQDIYDQMQASDKKSASVERSLIFTWQIMLPIEILLSIAVIGICYWSWRIPGFKKDELREWFLSWFPAKRFRILWSEIRGIDRRGYYKRRTKATGQLDLGITKLKEKQKHLKLFINIMKLKRKRIQNRILTVNEFITDMEKLGAEVATAIEGGEVDFQKSYKAIEMKAFEKNKANRESNKIAETPEDLRRLGVLRRRSSK